MKLKLLYLLAIATLMSCSTSYSTVQSTERQSSTQQTLPETLYYADNKDNGMYDLLLLDDEDEPQPIQGKQQWMRDFYGAIKYPALAREHGISGVVILDVKVDKSGKVTNVLIKKGISPDCDEEAKKAFIQSTKSGFVPLILDNRPVNFKMDVPVGFWLG